jgi:transposase
VNTKENKNNRRYEKGFKRSAVELMGRGDRSLKQLGMELGVTVSSLRDWKKKHGQSSDATSSYSPTASTASVDLAVEVARLRRELEVVSRQRDILKKACSILGQEPLNGLR